jgi:hypothetical protein
MAKVSFEQVRERALQAREAYRALNLSGKSNVLVYGDFGTGKSTFLGTAPTPIWLDSFDPGGTTTKALQPLIEQGLVIPVDYSGDSWRQPTKFREWERNFIQMRTNGTFDHIGTYCLDSGTKWADSMMYEIVKKGGFKNDGIPEQRSYLVQQITTVDLLGQMCALPCNFIMTGHIGLVKDEVSGKLETGLLLAGKLSEKVPLVFDEKWITRTRETPRGTTYEMQCHNDGYYKAETRMGGDTFEKFEEPNFRKLLIKAGREQAAQDKPPLFGD